MQKRVRIIDIAKMAGVSKGTVDRVLHERGNVSEKAREKVLKVIEELDYRPNIIARSLANNQTWRIAVLLPSPDVDPFWAQPQYGIDQAVQTVTDYGVSVQCFHFQDGDVASFLEETEEILKERFDALLMAPIFSKESESFLDKVEEQGTKYALINTYLKRETPNFLFYIGQDSYHSGVLGAKLLNFGIELEDAVMILHLEKGVYNSRHLLEKEQGFQNFFIEHSERNIQVIKTSFATPHEQEAFRSFIQLQIESYPRLKGIFVTTSKIYYLKEALETLGQPKIKLVGFDLIEPNLKYLRSEGIDFLINQNPVKQGYLGIINIVNHLVLKKEIKPAHYLPLDVVMKENAAYYLEPDKQLHLFF